MILRLRKFMFMLQQPITIKQVSQEKKEKSNKKVIPTKEEVDKGTVSL